MVERGRNPSEPVGYFDQRKVSGRRCDLRGHGKTFFWRFTDGRGVAFFEASDPAAGGAERRSQFVLGHAGVEP